MRKILIVALAAVLIIVIAGGYLAWSHLSSQSQNQNQDSNNTEATPSVEQIRDQAMTYIAANHTQTLPLMQAFHWSGGRQDTDLLGSETYQYTGGNWTIKLQYPVVLNPVYTITVNFSADDCIFDWTGTYQNRVITQTSSNTDTQTALTQEQIRDLTIQYLTAYHNQTLQYIHDFSWSGGRVDQGMMVGSDIYSYQSGGWNITMQYPVVPNPTYTLTAQYTPADTHLDIITWEGTLQNGTITETNYQYRP
jgi:hypothetical protein